MNTRRLALLKPVKEPGSINSASKELKMSYQQAWHYIKSMNELLPLPLIRKQPGESNGSGTVVTRYGEPIIREYEALLEQHKAFEAKIDDSLGSVCFKVLVKRQ